MQAQVHAGKHNKASAASRQASVHRLPVGFHYMTILFGAWLIGGVFIDGYAHNHGVVETFFTPWHAILYSGFLVCAAWICWLVYRAKRRTGLAWLQSIPSGYGLGLIGSAVFLTGGLCDMLWHVVFGIEKDIAALLSPSHLMLLVGGLLILSSPFRAAWNDGPYEIGWRAFIPPLVSLALTLGAVTFFLMYAWTPRYNLASLPVTNDYMARFYSGHVMRINQERGILGIIITTLVLVVPIFLLIRRWRLPFGAITALFMIVNVLMGALDGFVNTDFLVVAFAAGLASDLAYRWLRPEEGREWAVRLFALIVPTVLWVIYFLWMELSVGIGWDTELWTGSIVNAALASLALSLLAFAPRRPAPQRSNE